MEFTEIKKEIVKKVNSYYDHEFKYNQNDNSWSFGHTTKKYKGTLEQQKAKFIKFIENRKQKEINKELNYLKVIEETEDFKGDLVITIEWKKSYMWGMNPKAYTDKGFIGSSIGGCGYCKLSTATAEALNSDKSIIKLMCEKIEKELRNPKDSYTEQNGRTEKGTGNLRVEVLGYGSGYGAIPSFSGGVGVSCHERILKNIGLNMRDISNTNTTNVYLITRGGEE